MAKKFVRGITDIKNIEHQDFDTNNVNDLLSDGQNNFIHRKKGNSEEYHNLTNNIKTIQSDNTDLLTVTNYNNTTNSATIRPKHDSLKEQVLESTDNTILIEHGENGTEETTNVDVNFDKVQAKLTAGDGLAIENNQINIKPTSNGDPNNNGFYKGILIDDNLSSSIISLECTNNKIVQVAFRESGITDGLMIMRYRFVNSGVATEWKLASIDSEQLTSLLSQKQNTLTSNSSIGIVGTGLQQLYTNNETYTHENGTLITYSKSVANSTSISTVDEEFHLFVRLNKGTTTASFTLNEHDTAVFNYLMTEHGVNNQVNINNGIFTLDGSTLEYYNNSTGVTYNNFLTTFTFIIPSNPTPENVTSSNSREELTQETE